MTAVTTDLDCMDSVALGKQTSKFSFEATGLHRARSKSKISLCYAQELRKKNRSIFIFWLDAGSREAFVQTYLKIASHIGLQFPEPMVGAMEMGSRNTESGQAMIAQIKDWLDNSHWLMIVDNADDASILVDPPDPSLQLAHQSTDALISYIPTAAHGKVIFTSRNKQAALKLTRNGKILHIPTMRTEEAIELFSRKVDGDADSSLADEAASAAELLILLDYLPLAIVQAASYIRKNSGSVKSYLDLYCESKDSKTKLLSNEFDDPSRKLEQPNAVTLTWAISFNEIKKQRPEAADALSVMSLFNSKYIPKALLRTAERGAYDLDEDLGLLKAYSLISSNAGNTHFFAHDLVQVAMRRWMEQSLESSRIVDIAVLRLYEYYSSRLVGQWHKCAIALPHAIALYSLIQSSETRKHEYVFNLFHTSSHLAVIGQWKNAEEMGERALALGQGLYKPASLEIISLLGNAASISIRSGKPGKGEAKLRQVIDLQEKVPEVNAWDRLLTAKRLAYVISRQGDPEAALNILEPAIAAAGQHPAITCNFDYFDAYLISGFLLQDQGIFDKAEEKFNWVHESIQDMTGVMQEYLIAKLKTTAMTRLSTGLIEQGKYEEGREVLEGVLDQARRIRTTSVMEELDICSNLVTI